MSTRPKKDPGVPNAQVASYELISSPQGSVQSSLNASRQSSPIVSPTDDHVHAPVNAATAQVYTKQLDTVNPLDTKYNCLDDKLQIPTAESVKSPGCEDNKPMTHVMSVLDPESSNFNMHLGEKLA